MSDNDYMTVAGIVQFDPNDREAAGKKVRDVLIRAIGNNKRIKVTVWESHAHIPINKGDFIIADGSYQSSPGQNKQGEQITYHNLSAYTLFRFTNDETQQANKPKAALPETADDDGDFPF